MNKFLISILITLSTVIIFGQNFEGKITYSNTYISKNPKITSQQLQIMMGGVQEYYIKGGDYKSVTNGSMMEWQLYLNAENKLYSKIPNSGTVFWNDGITNLDSILSMELNPDVMKILGYQCDELILTCKSGIQKYYFNSALKVDASLFKNHLFGNWYDFLKVSNSLPLKMIIESKQFTIENVATEVNVMKINASELMLPVGIKTARIPY